MNREFLYLLHVKESITRIEQYTREGKDVFSHDVKTQDAVLRNLQTLAESTQRLSEAVREAHPEVEWRAISAFRNVLVHDYLGIDLERVWEIVQDGTGRLCPGWPTTRLGTGGPRRSPRHPRCLPDRPTGSSSGAIRSVSGPA
ncbi:MAG: DUF86 domain-containing protein [Thermoleophilia bacterium]|nr:DUF86 domain-containing protein [Thermoleophilia bacterium]